MGFNSTNMWGFMASTLTMILPRKSIGWNKSHFTSLGWRKNDIMWKSHRAIMMKGIPLVVPLLKTLAAYCPLVFWPRDLPMDSIHHDTPLAFPHDVPLTHIRVFSKNYKIKYKIQYTIFCLGSHGFCSPCLHYRSHFSLTLSGKNRATLSTFHVNRV